MERADPKDILGYPGIVTSPLSPYCIEVTALYTLACPALFINAIPPYSHGARPSSISQLTAPGLAPVRYHGP